MLKHPSSITHHPTKYLKNEKVFHLSVECFPVAKVGGLADVVGALPKYQTKMGIDAKVVMPWYNKPFVNENEFK